MGPDFTKWVLIFVIVSPIFINVGPAFTNINLVLVNGGPGFLMVGLGFMGSWFCGSRDPGPGNRS